MAGRTHGQPGAPITFGFKVASWADEVRRHLSRLAEGRSRWVVGQLGGAVGVSGFFAPHGMALRAEFCRELGLADPGISWLTARDRIAEFGGVLALICGTLGRIGDEVYELQRPEIGELREPTRSDTVGSITMPHKRNPEGSEHLVTLARLVRSNAAVLVEGMVGAHERDGRSWKAEWAALPEVCLLTGVALQQARTLLAGIAVDMSRDAREPRTVRESAGVGANSGRVDASAGKTSGAAADARRCSRPAAGPSRDIVGALSGRRGRRRGGPGSLTGEWAVGDAPAMVDAVIARGRAAQAAEPEVWI